MENNLHPWAMAWAPSGLATHTHIRTSHVEITVSERKSFNRI